MPLVASAFGLDATAGAVTSAPRSDIRVRISTDNWVTLSANGEKFTRPVSGAWAAIAAGDQRVVLIIGYRPMPAGMDEITYSEIHGDYCVIGLIPAGRV